MSLPRIVLCMAAALALGTTAAEAAPLPVPSGSRPKPTHKSAPDSRPKVKLECPTPGRTQCLEDGYLDSRCGERHHAVCRPFVQEEMKRHYEASSVPKVKMLRPKQSQMPKHVTRGKYFAYKKGAKIKIPKGYNKANDVLGEMAGMNMSSKAPVDRVTTIDPAAAAKWHREFAWKHNGRAVRSCKEYAYARSYDVTRFVDAASACKGDQECVFKIAYMTNSPGIANHDLRNEDGVAIAQLPLPVGKYQKNDFFAPNIIEFVRAGGKEPLPETPEMLRLESALRTGAKYYDIGRCKGNKCDGRRKFHDVWDWHEHLHDVTTAMSQAEAEEYERRRSELRGLLEQWHAAVNHEAGMLEQRPPEQPIVLPFDMRAYDPFERYDFEQEYIEHGRSQAQKFQRRFGPNILRKNLEQAVQQVHGALRPRTGVAVGVLATPARTPANRPPETTKPTQGSSAQGATAGVSDNPCARAGVWGLETGKMGPLSCKIGLFLRSEWGRKEAGQRSCLDADDPRCDWTPQMFQASVLEKIPKVDVQVADEAFCNRWSDANTFKDIPAESIVATVTRVKSLLEANKARIETELAAVSDYIRGPGDIGLRLGKQWEGGDYVGDKDWFAAGYDYDLGWDAEPAKKNSSDRVCQLKGSAHAEMSFDAWIIASKKNVVDGAVWAESKPDNGGKARINAHLQMFDQSVFNTNGWAVAQTFGDDPSSDLGIQLPKPKPRFDVYVGVPISGQMWGELLFGSTLDVSGQSATSCSENSPNFAVSASYMPFFGAFGLGQVGVGIAGVASAGIRASLALMMMGIPVEVGMHTRLKNDVPTLSFTSELKLMLVTLSGRVSLYVEFLMFDEEFELFRWKGFSATVPLMPKLSADVSLAGLR